MGKRLKLLVIGLDGARLDLIRKWGLPTLHGLIDDGFAHNLNVTFPHHTLLSCASFLTGKGPGEHRIYNYLIWVKGTNRFKVPNARDIMGQPFYDILSNQGKRIGLINLPMTFPPHQVNGVMVNSWLAPPGSVYFYPRQLSEILEKFNYEILVKDEDDALLPRKLFEVEKKRFELARHLLKEDSYGFFLVYCIGTELMHHRFAPFLNPDHPEYDPSYEILVEEFYQRIDEQIALLIRETDPCNVIIFSDHGFCAVDPAVDLNAILQDSGLLKRIESEDRRTLRDTWRNFRDKHDLIKKISNLRLKIQRAVLSHQQVQGINLPFDWEQTRAFCHTQMGTIRINLKGREQYGIVEPGYEYEKLRDHIIAILQNEAEIGRIYRKEELYAGPCLEEIDDLYVRFHGCRVSKDYSGMEPPSQGFHTAEGILIGSGPDVGPFKYAVEITELASCILSVFGIDYAALKSQSPIVYDSEEAKQVEDRLRELGYLG